MSGASGTEDIGSTELSPALPLGGPPTFTGAIWIGSVDIGQIDMKRPLRLRESSGFQQARLLVRRGTRVFGFIEAPIDAGHVDAAVLKPALQALPDTSTPAAGAVGADITVVLCTRDRVDMLKTALASILALDDEHLRVIVVDNAARTGYTRQHVANLDDPRVRLVVEAAPGLARARNAGLRAATTEIVAFTDDDVVVDAYWLRGLAEGFSEPAVACVSGIVPSGEIRTPAQAYFDQRVGWARNCEPRVYRTDAPPADVPLFPFQVGMYGTGANFAVRRSVIVELGGFDEALGAGAPTRGGEDLDMFFRMLCAGWHLAYQPAAVVWHRHRSDPDALAEQARAYGLGLGALLTKIAVNPSTAKLALRTVITKAPTILRFSYRLSKIASPPDTLVDDLPGNMGALELAWILKGPLAYRAARREGRRSAPSLEALT